MSTEYIPFPVFSKLKGITWNYAKECLAKVAMESEIYEDFAHVFKDFKAPPTVLPVKRSWAIPSTRLAPIDMLSDMFCQGADAGDHRKSY